MELKPGYKMTEAGVIPEDWMSFELGKYGNLQKQVITPSSYPNQIFYEYSMPAFDDGEKPAKIYGKEIHSNKTKITGEVILFNKLNVRQRRVWLVNNASNNAICSTEFLSYKTKKVTLNLLKQILLTDKVTIYFENKSTGTSNSQKRITPNTFLEFKCCVPQSLTEQQAIAAALSDVDELLSSLDQLIAKKKDIRLAAMQELLTGKIRLPGFGGSWSRKRLEELAEINPENLSASTSSNYEFNYIALEDVSKGHLLKFSHYSFADSPVRARRIIKPKDILVSTVRPNLKSHLLATDNENNWICSTGFCIVRCHKNLVEPTYVYHSLFTDDIEYQIKLIVTGSNYPAINSSDVTNLKIYLPSSLAEQQAIASVLSDMDAEIEALEARRDKVRHIKAGMMQELLTGKTRLISSGERA